MRAPWNIPGRNASTVKDLDHLTIKYLTRSFMTSYAFYLYSGISNGQVVQAISLFRIVIAIEVLQQQYSFPNVRRIFAPHKAPGVFELCFLRNK